MSYIKGTIMILVLAITFALCGYIDSGAEAGVYPQSAHATVEIVVTLDDGNSYVVNSYEKDVTVCTYHSDYPGDWDICNWKK